MGDEAFAELEQAVEDALAFERRERRDLQVIRIQARSKDRMEAIQGIKRGLESMKRNAGKPAADAAPPKNLAPGRSPRGEVDSGI